MFPEQYPRYRADIDGLRAIAITLVLLYHAAPKALPGGFIGVDVFFVISGYLITTILRRHAEAGDFAYSPFYARRIIRLVPALTIVFAASAAAGWRYLFSADFAYLGRHLFNGALFLSNIGLWQEAGYFDIGAERKALLHLWSLGVEEQFYLLWPPLLMVVLRSKRPRFITALVLVASFAICVMVTAKHPIGAFFLLPSRFWELLVGAILSLTETKHSLIERHGAWPRDVVSGIAIVALILAAFVLDGSTPYPGAYALVPTLAAAALIVSDGSRINASVLSSRPAVYLGLISYPLYLWHWPLLYFFRSINGDSLPAGWAACALLLSVVAAALTYRFVERPLRAMPRARRPLAAASLLVVLAAVAVLGQSMKSGLLQARLAGQEQALSAALNDWASPEGGMEGSRMALTAARGGTGETALFIGDSHMAQYWPRLERRLREDPVGNRDAVLATWGGCPPLPETRQLASTNQCPTFVNKAFDAAAAPQVRVVVLGAFWEGYFLGTLHRDGAAANTLVSMRPDALVPLTWGGTETERVFDDFESRIARLTQQGKRVVILLSNPAGRENNPREMLNALRRDGSVNIDSYAIERRAFVDFEKPVADRLRLAAQRTGAEIVDPVDFLCAGEICPSSSDGKPIYRDDDHMRPFFVAGRVTYLDSLLATGSRRSK